MLGANMETLIQLQIIFFTKLKTQLLYQGFNGQVNINQKREFKGLDLS